MKPATSFILGLLLLGPAAVAQDDPGQSPLATKQVIIRDRFLRLQDQMFRLIEKLEANEPELAARLKKALNATGEMGIRQDFSALIDLLNDDTRLGEAGDIQSGLTQDLERLLGLLMSDEEEDKKKEIERLEKFLKDIERLIEDEQDLANASVEATREQLSHAPDIGAATAVRELIDRQKAINAQTSQARADGQAPPEALAADQKKLAKDTEALAQEFSTGGQEAKSAEALESAMFGMEDATEQIEDDQLGAATDAQAEALADLEEAMKSLTRRPPAGQESADTEAMKKDQDEVQERTEELAEQMDGDAQDPSSEPAPGTQDVQKAGGHMKSAGKQLGKKNPAGAAPQQEDAVNHLKRARSEVARKIQELKQEEQDKKLNELKERFARILEEEQSILRATQRLGAVADDKFGRPEKLETIRESEIQAKLATDVEDCLEIISEDGTTTVLPQLVEYIRDDMRDVALRLARVEVGPLTQARESEIVQALEDILDIIDQAQSDQQQSSDPPQSQQGDQKPQDPPLLPTSAELRLLARLQQRIFDQTRDHDRLRKNDPARVERLARQQKEVAGMAEVMSEKIK